MSSTKLDEQEDFYRRSIMNAIKTPHLYELASKEGYKKGKDNRVKIIKHILSLPLEKFEELIEEYGDAQNSTNFILVLENELNQSFKENYAKRLEHMPVKPVLGGQKLFLEKYTFNETNNELRLRFKSIHIKTYAQQWDYEINRSKYFRADEIETIPVRILFEKNLTVIRSRRSNTGTHVKNLIFGKDSEKVHPIIFEKEDKIKIYDYITVVRNAKIKFPKEKQMTASFSAGIDESEKEMRNLKRMQRFLEALQEGELRNILFSIPIKRKEDVQKEEDTSKEEDSPSTPKEDGVPTVSKEENVITAGINFAESKIYFKTFLTEAQTREWILEILDLLDLSKYTKAITDLDEFGDES